MITNFFPIQNQANINFTYKLWQVSGLSPDDDEYEKNRVALRLKAGRDTHAPAETIVRDDTLFLALPAGHTEPQEKYDLSPSVVRLTAVPDSKSLKLLDAKGQDKFLVTRFLQSAVTNKLWSNPRMWQPRAGRPYYYKLPSNASNRSVDVFEGFAVRVQFIQGFGYCVIVDCKTHYVSAKPLPAIIPYAKRWDYLRHGNNSPSKQKQTHCVYRFGNQWYEISVRSILKDAISQTEFIHPDTNNPVSVYDYTIERWKEALPDWCTKLSEEWSTITYETWKGAPKRHGIAHLCYPVIKTADLYELGSGKLHQHAIIKPQDRLTEIERFVQNELSDVRLGGQHIAIPPHTAEVKNKYFAIPVLEFGNGQRLDIENTQIKLADYPRARMKILEDPRYGFWGKKPLQDQWVILPKDLKSTGWASFQSALSKQISKMYKEDYEYNPSEIIYEALGTDLFQQLSAIRKAIRNHSNRSGSVPSGYCLVILPANAHHELPAVLTSTLSANDPPLHVACIHKDSLQSAFPQHTRFQHNRNSGRAKGYVRNVAIKLLLLNDIWPFYLASQNPKNLLKYEKRLAETLFIGFDVLNSVAGFTFLGKGGQICFFEALDSEDKERISRRKVNRIVQKKIAELSDAYDWKPQRVVLIRDGRLFDRELQGFKDACSSQGIKLIDAVEIPKYLTLSSRFFARVENEILNPELGQWYSSNTNEISVITTGWPFRTPGTTQPLTVRKRDGGSSIVDLGQDMFNLAQLAWTAPDRPARYPFPIRYCDMRLQHIAAEYDEDEAEYGDDTDKDQLDQAFINE